MVSVIGMPMQMILGNKLRLLLLMGGLASKYEDARFDFDADSSANKGLRRALQLIGLQFADSAKSIHVGGEIHCLLRSAQG